RFEALAKHVIDDGRGCGLEKGRRNLTRGAPAQKAELHKGRLVKRPVEIARHVFAVLALLEHRRRDKTKRREHACFDPEIAIREAVHGWIESADLAEELRANDGRARCCDCGFPKASPCSGGRRSFGIRFAVDPSRAALFVEVGSLPVYDATF